MKNKILFLSSVLLFSLKISCITKEQQDIVNHVKKSITLASEEKSNINKPILQMKGMSSPKVRHLLNNLCTLPNCNYLEIGLWKGSTFMSALSNNDSSINSAIGIDNWSKIVGSPRDAFFQNIQKLSNIGSVTIYEEDSFKVGSVEF